MSDSIDGEIKSYKIVNELLRLRVDESNAACAEMRVAIEDLLDVQNGPPLVTWKDAWEKAVDACTRAMKRTKVGKGWVSPEAAGQLQEERDLALELAETKLKAEGWVSPEKNEKLRAQCDEYRREWGLACERLRADPYNSKDWQEQAAKLAEENEKLRSRFDSACVLNAQFAIEDRELRAENEKLRAELKEKTEALESIAPFLPTLDAGPVRYAEHAQATGKVRTALSKGGAK